MQIWSYCSSKKEKEKKNQKTLLIGEIKQTLESISQGVKRFLFRETGIICWTQVCDLILSQHKVVLMKWQSICASTLPSHNKFWDHLLLPLTISTNSSVYYQMDRISFAQKYQKETKKIAWKWNSGTTHVSWGGFSIIQIISDHWVLRTQEETEPHPCECEPCTWKFPGPS